MKSILGVLLLIFCASVVFAGDEKRAPVFISASYLMSNTDQNGFDSAEGESLTIGVDLNKISLAIGYISLDKHKLSNAVDTHVETDGYLVSVIKKIKLASNVVLDLKAGSLFWNANSRFLGSNAGSDDGTSFSTGVGIGVYSGQLIGVSVGVDRYFDVSGSNINQVSFGLSKTF